MKLTSRSEYALLALVYLARQDTREYVPVEAIAAAQGIPSKFLEQIMLVLKHARCLRSRRGQYGGYCLAKPADKIALAEIIRAFEGALAPTESVSRYFHGSTPIQREEKLVRVFQDIRDDVSMKLEKITLADVC
jgi:Rrf2 family cysteine metabolism transcriptional repressor